MTSLNCVYEDDFRIHRFTNLDEIKEELMRIRTDIITKITPFEVDYDLAVPDKLFYY